jgi:hypothetical protein
LRVSGSLSGTTALNISGGALELADANRLNDLAPVLLSGGTFNTGSFSETVGTLTLQGTATIDLGAGVGSILHLADSAALGWSGTLTITHWSGSIAGAGADQILFGTSSGGLTGVQLALVQFVDPAGFLPGTYAAQLLSTGELVAVPEPDAWLHLVGAFGMLAGLRRFRRGA